MKASELRTKSVKDIETQLLETRVELVTAQRNLKSGELANPRVIRNHRRDIALIHTVLNEQKREEAKEKA